MPTVQATLFFSLFFSLSLSRFLSCGYFVSFLFSDLTSFFSLARLVSCSICVSCCFPFSASLFQSLAIALKPSLISTYQTLSDVILMFSMILILPLTTSSFLIVFSSLCFLMSTCCSKLLSVVCLSLHVSLVRAHQLDPAGKCGIYLITSGNIQLSMRTQRRQCTNPCASRYR